MPLPAPKPKPVMPGEFFNAVRASNYELMEELVQRGANVNELDPIGNTPLMYVAGRTGYPLKFVEFLIKNKALVNAKGNADNTALILASSVNNVSVAEVLLKNGADIDTRNKLDYTAEEVARKWGHVQIIKAIHDELEVRRKIAEEKEKIEAAHETALKRQQELKDKAKRRRPPSL